MKLCILLGLGLLVFMIEKSDGISCYECDSDSQSNCKDKFSSSGIDKCDGRACMKIWAKQSGKTGIARGCYDDTLPVPENDCINLSNSGVESKICYCNSDLCNNSDSNKPYLKMVTMMSFAVAAMMITKWAK